MGVFRSSRIWHCFSSVGLTSGSSAQRWLVLATAIAFALPFALLGPGIGAGSPRKTDPGIPGGGAPGFSQSSCTPPSTIADCGAPVVVSGVVRDDEGVPLANVSIEVVLVAEDGVLHSEQLVAVGEVTGLTGTFEAQFPYGVVGAGPVRIEIRDVQSGGVICTSANYTAVCDVMLPFPVLGGLDFAPTSDFQFNTDSDSLNGMVMTAGADVVDEDGIPLGLREYRVYQFENITIPNGVRVSAVGSLPMVWIARGSVDIDGLVDVCGTTGVNGANGGLIDLDGNICGPGGGGGGAGGGSFAIFGGAFDVGASAALLAIGGQGGLGGSFPPEACAGDPQCYADSGFVPGTGLGGIAALGHLGGGDGGNGGSSVAGGGGGDGANKKVQSTGSGGGGGGGGGYGGNGGQGGLGRKNGSEGSDSQADQCTTPGPGAPGGTGGGTCHGTGGIGGDPVGARTGGNGGNGSVTGLCSGAGGGGGGGGATDAGHGGWGGAGTEGRGGGGGGGGGADNCGPGNAGSGRPAGTGGGGGESGGNGNQLYTPPAEGSLSEGEGGGGGGGGIIVGSITDIAGIAGLIDARGGAGRYSDALGGLGTLELVGVATVSGSVHAGFTTHANGISNRQFYLDGGGAGGGGGGSGKSILATVSVPHLPPTDAVVLAARPNPFRSGLRVDLAKYRPGPARLVVVDVAGRLVHSQDLSDRPPGAVTVYWDGMDIRGTRVPVGRYLVTVHANGFEGSTGVVRIE